VEHIEHPIVREALKMLGLGPHLEILSMADLPSNTGLGSSGSFTVGLLLALHAFKRESIDAQRLAEEAFHIEAELLGDPVGKQDQYIAAFGHVTEMTIDPEGAVMARRIDLDPRVQEQLENETLLFYTGIKRDASEVLSSQQASLTQHKTDVVGSLHEIKQIGQQVTHALSSGDLTSFGKLLDQHWQSKKGTSTLMTTSDIDRWYACGLANGALGGKLMGAGGGGFLMFYCPNDCKPRVRQALNAEGLQEMRFAIDDDGAKVIVNL
jgi:D-glycero-alpha-D-manno-heptose-7-phosphate kinase